MFDSVVKRWISASVKTWQGLFHIAEVQQAYYEGLAIFQQRVMDLLQRHCVDIYSPLNDNIWTFSTAEGAQVNIKLRSGNEDCYALPPVSPEILSSESNPFLNATGASSLMNDLLAVGAELIFYHQDHLKSIAHFQYVSGMDIARLTVDIRVPQ